MSPLRMMELEAKRRLIRRRNALLRQIHGPAWDEISSEEDLEARKAQADEAQKSGRLSNREQRELFDIDEALARMRRGEYGLCSTCGNPVGRARLLAVPEARICLACEGREADSPHRH